MLSLKAPVYLDGTFINPLYFADAVGQICSELTFSQRLPETLSLIEEEISKTNSIGIHVRRGDYTTPFTKRIYPLYGDDYVRRAVAFIEIEKRVLCGRYFVFSDDIDWVAQNILVGDNTVYVSRYTASPWMDLYLMTRCRHLVISNSTFSWWGAFLNHNHGKIVVCPRKWRNDSINTDDMLLDNWIAI